MSTVNYQPRLQVKYKDEVVSALMKKFNYTSVMQVPKLVKICLNQGVKGSVSDKKLVDDAVKEMTMIAGQKAVPTMSKKDISNFKLRKNMPIGARVTLRGSNMFEFLDRWYLFLCHVYVTSKVSTTRHLMVTVTTLSVLLNKSFTLRSISIKLAVSAVWISLS